MPPLLRFCLFPLMLLTGLVASAESDTVNETLAFPGAEGFGRFATGGRGGEVIAVTNLNDSGPGSLRAAVEAEGARTIVFRVGGTIRLETPIRVKNGDLTIAGQTAPGDGITLARRGLVVAETDNVIIRFIRVRLGDDYAQSNGLEHFQEDAFECRYATNIIVDHCSFSWGIDETATVYRVRNTTFQWNFVTEALNDSFHYKGRHGFGGIWGGDHVSFHHNLIATHRSRLPRYNGARYGDYEEWGDGLIDHRNNVIYNWGDNNAYGGEPHRSGYQARYNFVGNFYKPGPASRSARDRLFDAGTNHEGAFSRFYLADNVVLGAPAVTANNRLGLDTVPEEQRAEVIAEEPFPVAPIRTDSAAVAYERVLQSGGAALPRRDPVDTRIVEEVRTGTSGGGEDGLIDSQTEVGGYPELAGGAAPPDSDGDGLPDAWEDKHGLDAQNPTDGAAVADASGYTFLELYLNELAVALGSSSPTPES